MHLPPEPSPQPEKLQAPWVELCPLDSLTVGRGAYRAVGNRGLAIFRLGPQQVHVIDNSCPHAGAALAGGRVEGCVVYCLRHFWGFDLTTGELPENPRVKVATYPTKIHAGKVWVELQEEG